MQTEDENLAEIRQIFGYDPLTVDYLSNMSEKYRYLYIETPKAACSTIKRQLQFAELDGDESRLPPEVHDRSSSPLAMPSNKIDTFRLAINGAFFKFCFVRNPYTRALSCYLDKFVENEWERDRLGPMLGFSLGVVPTFVEFLAAVEAQPQGERDIHWESQAFHLKPEAVNYTFIGRFEHFSADFLKVVSLLRMPKFDNWRNFHATAAKDKLHEYYGDEECRLVSEIYRKDFLTFGYGFGLELV